MDSAVFEWVWKIGALVVAACSGAIAYAWRIDTRMTRLEERMIALTDANKRDHAIVLEALVDIKKQNERMDERQRGILDRVKHLESIGGR